MITVYANMELQPNLPLAAKPTVYAVGVFQENIYETY